MDTWITEMCRTRCRRQLVIWSAVSAPGLLRLYAERDYVQGFVRGPRAVAAAELASLTEPDGSRAYYVAVSGARAIDTGAESTRSRPKRVARWSAVWRIPTTRWRWATSTSSFAPAAKRRHRMWRASW